MRAIAFTMARKRVASLIAVFVAVLFGAVAVTTCAVLGETGIRGTAPPGRFADADVLVGAPAELEQVEDIDIPLAARAPVDASVIAAVAAVPGVERVIADLSVPAAPVTGGQAVPGLTGHGWSSAMTGEITGRAPTGPGELALDAATAARLGLAPGATTDVIAGGKRASYTVTGVAAGAPEGLYWDDATAAALAGRAADLLAVWAAPGADTGDLAEAIAAAAGPGPVVATGDDRGEVENPAAAGSAGELIAMAGALSGTILMVVGFMVAAALSVHVAGQAPELALMRAVGATPRQARRLVAAQGTVTALLALPFGIAGGYALAGVARDWFVSLGMLSPEIATAWSPLPALIAIVLFLLTVGLSARAAAFGVSRLPVTSALAQTNTEPRPEGPVRSAIGFGLVGLALVMTAAPVAMPGIAGLAAVGGASLMSVIGLALAGPALMRKGAVLIARFLPRRAGVTSWLAAHNIGAYAARTAGAVTGLALAVTLAVTNAFLQTTPDEAARAELAAGLSAPVSVTAPALRGVPAYAVDALAAEPGARVATFGSTTVYEPSEQDGKQRYEDHPATVLGGDVALADPEVTDGDLAAVKDTSVAVSASFALWGGLSTGDEVGLLLADGRPVTVTVVAVYAREFGFGSMILAPGLGSGPPSTVIAEGLDAARAREVLSIAPGTLVGGEVGAAAAERPDKWVNLVVIGGLLGYVLLGVVNGLVAATARRRPEFDALRHSGATPRQLMAVARAEALFFGAGAAAVGLALSLPPLLFLGVGALGSPLPVGPYWLIPVMCGVVLAAAYFATVVPARRLLAR
ncbi:membrane protein [Actinorhabdospora filicis]|uniref:Membrane protein n=1 Tax=Actinorhabdospora filicis TaxID=1785913 RepID=A0A9W6W7J3_9ACTN|nr:ABC transporter permease [Actinorhabdospora filicis]GLZ75546.1 membrane protein [Actinorhabdospora filicis]